MVTKIKKNSSATDSNTNTNTHTDTGDNGTRASAARGPQLADMVRESAQQIWQAGLGAFSKAQAEGSKAFEALVKEGSVLQRKTQAAAEEKVNEATSRMSSMANDISSRATGQWDKLEGIFEERVAKALQKLGVPSAKDVQTLIARVDELNGHVQALAKQSAGANAAKTPKATPPAAKAVRKSTAKSAGARSAANAAPAAAAAPAKSAPAKRKTPARKTGSRAG